MTKTKIKGLLALAFTLVLAVAAVGMFPWGTSAKAYNSDAEKDYKSVEFDFWAGNSKVEGNMSIENAGWPITDKLVLTLKAGSGTPGAIVRYKARYYWGNKTIKPGAEVLMEEHTLGSSVSSWDLWCDHGGIPNNTGTSNKRWNCNFVVFWLQAKGGNGQVVDYRLIFNFNDGEKDTFITDCQKDTALLEEWRKDFRSWSPAW